MSHLAFSCHGRGGGPLIRLVSCLGGCADILSILGISDGSRHQRLGNLTKPSQEMSTIWWVESLSGLPPWQHYRDLLRLVWELTYLPHTYTGICHHLDIFAQNWCVCCSAWAVKLPFCVSDWGLVFLIWQPGDLGRCWLAHSKEILWLRTALDPVVASVVIPVRNAVYHVSLTAWLHKSLLLYYKQSQISKPALFFCQNAMFHLERKDWNEL